MYVDYIYQSRAVNYFFFSKVTHKANGEQNGMLVIRADQKKTTIHCKNLFVFRTRKASL